jgi:DNA polymerase-3 subunit delta
MVAAAAGDGDSVREVTGGSLSPGDLASLTSPSLFDAAPVVVVREAQDAGKEVAEELAALAGDPPPDLAVVITHAGGGDQVTDGAIDEELLLADD